MRALAAGVAASRRQRLREHERSVCCKHVILLLDRKKTVEECMKTRLNWIAALAALVLAGHAAAQVTFYEQEGFRGRTFTTDRPVQNFDRTGFNDRASSIIID